MPGLPSDYAEDSSVNSLDTEKKSRKAGHMSFLAASFTGI